MESTTPANAADSNRHLLRHTLATLAYRTSKALRDAPPAFADFGVGASPKTPVQILAHMGDLLDWALSGARGKQVWHDAAPLPWAEEIKRFFQALKAFDDYLASELPLGYSAEKFFQGPVADALTHTGQLAMLRRLAGSPMSGENYFRADIVVGRVGEDQSAPPKKP